MQAADPNSSATCWRLRHDVPKVAAAGSPVHYIRPMPDDPTEHLILTAPMYGEAVPLTVPAHYLTPPATLDWINPVTELPKLVSIADTQARLGGISRGTVYKLIASRHLERVKVGARAMITRDSLDAYLTQIAKADHSA
ncbi:helix-turn-helix DNA binding protein [Gordonia phage MelBins]|uniref:Helix-turn-helix DNA binding protein n=1 Tax=Gordonia phage MelBins TaxID=2656540 RepID=A0A649VMG8_9CAUD|nr:helix-turn-helix DNA binding protein [Gordonia phage MelBins]QGJ93606.1 helix-turn-helix DNA binding protein [Gordonia phage MelBins]